MEIKFRINEGDRRYLSVTGATFKDVLGLQYAFKVHSMKRMKYHKISRWYYLVTARINPSDYKDLKATVEACGYTKVDTDSLTEVIGDLMICFSETMPKS